MSLQGLMMERPLLISSIIGHAAAVHGRSEIVSSDAAGTIHRYTYGDSARRIAQLAHGLIALGVRPGDRIATVAWNNYRHFELYYAISGIGAVCHTVNPRLFADQLIHIFNHAGDRFVFVDPELLPLVAALKEHLPRIEGVIVMAGTDAMPDTPLSITGYETLLDGQPEHYDWPTFDERTAAALCYTSGTTGNPKGVLYSHRSTVLHGLGAITAHDGHLTSRDIFLPVVPMFHVCAWGYPYICPMMGTAMVMPGPRLDGPSLHALLEQEKVTATAGVPTIWYGLMEHLRQTGGDLNHLKKMVCGGAAAPLALVQAIEAHGVEFIHGWGLTETSPIAAACPSVPDGPGATGEDRLKFKLRQGRPPFGLEMKIVDDNGDRVAHDGSATGEVLVRGNAVTSGYYRADEGKGPFDGDGWFRTGDIGAIDLDGNLLLTDRAKDLIKSGGEWISSIELENVAAGHPALAAAAAIAIAHPKWGERPLLVVAPAEGQNTTKAEILAFMEGKIAKWWMPDDVAFIDSMPLTATGKVSKLQLRERFADYKLPTA